MNDTTDAMNSSVANADTESPDSRRWLALAVLLVGTLLPPLDFFIVNVALPAIREDMRASPGVAQLVVSVYATAYAVTLILGGRLGDIHGRKRCFMAGMLSFGVASALCGLASSPTMLVVGRALQGVSAAVMAPQSLAFIHALFPAHEKGRALSLYGATFGLASVTGQLLGGVLVSADLFGVGWRSVFLINLPIIALAIPAALKLLSEGLVVKTARLDIPGALLLAAGLLSLVVPLIEGRERGWPWWCSGLLVLSVPLLVTFWKYERHQEHIGGFPLVLPSLLLLPGLQRSLLAAFFFYFLASFFLIFSVYEQLGLAHNALTAGLAILPLGVGFLLGPLTNPFFARRLGTRTAALGIGLEVFGLALAAALANAEKPTQLVLPLFLIGAGQGIALPALVRLSVDQVDLRWAGLAAGLVSASLQISAAVSVALIGGLFFALAPDDGSPQNVGRAFSASTLAIAGALILAGYLSWSRPKSY